MIKSVKHIILLIFGFIPLISFAQVIVTNSSSISLNGNAVLIFNNLDLEKNGNIHDNSSSKIVFKGNQDIDISGSGLSFNNIIVDNTNDLILQNPLTIMNSLTFTNGHIVSSDTKELSFSDGTTYTNSSNSSHVIGPMKKQGNDDFIFPIGNGAVYAPIEISGLTGTETFTAEYKKNNPNTDGYLNTSLGADIYNISSQEYWLLSKLGLEEAFVTLYWNSVRSGEISTISDLLITHWNTTPDPDIWEKIPNNAPTGNSSSGSIKSNALVSSFSPFTLGSSSSDNPLPVSLSDFSASQQNESIKIIWTTESEINNDEFILEKSKNGLDFYTIANVTGAGTSSTTKQYAEYDLEPAIINYYRLAQIDFDGTITYSNTISVSLKSFDKTTIAFDKKNIFVKNLYPHETYTIRISNESGKVIFKTDIQPNSSIENIPFQFTPGVWIISISKNQIILDSKKIVFK